MGGRQFLEILYNETVVTKGRRTLLKLIFHLKSKFIISIFSPGIYHVFQMLLGQNST